MDIVVLGGGVVGVTSAWYLAKAGHKVTLLERRDGVALETSHANAGQISRVMLPTRLPRHSPQGRQMAAAKARPLHGAAHLGPSSCAGC